MSRGKLEGDVGGVIERGRERMGMLIERKGKNEDKKYKTFCFSIAFVHRGSPRLPNGNIPGTAFI